ncbi:hypothetical protein [Nocardia inohanensis]|uniref:hypothetical protein n=1 Tax=Nocardia inohanensis TaxID=209246 RepID=UPI00082A100A|nr:hypothetical protein [Nocardia inohanensis]
MKQYWGLFWAGAVMVIAVVALTVWADLDTHTVVAVSLGLVAFFWLLVILTVPWNLYYAARQAAHRMSSAQRQEIPVPPTNTAELFALTKRLLAMAVGSHIISALIAVIISIAFGYILGYYFAAFFLLSVVFRPVAAYFAYVRARIAAISYEADYPPDTVLALRSEVQELAHRMDELQASVRTWQSTADSALLDQREIVAGLRAVARLLRTGSDPAPGTH